MGSAAPTLPWSCFGNESHQPRSVRGEPGGGVRRPIRQSRSAPSTGRFFSCPVDVAAWLLEPWLAQQSGQSQSGALVKGHEQSRRLLPAAAFGSSRIVPRGTHWDGRALRKGWPWLLAAAFLVSLGLTQYFIPSASTREHPILGVGWHFYFVVSGASYLILIIQAIYDLRQPSPVSRRSSFRRCYFGGAASRVRGCDLSHLPRAGAQCARLCHARFQP